MPSVDSLPQCSFALNLWFALQDQLKPTTGPEGTSYL